MKFKKPKFWDSKNPHLYSYLLFPFSIIISLFSKIRLKPKSVNPKIRTVCVGNIYIGGTGKTTLAIKIKKILEERDIKVCFIKKFYSDQIDEQKLLGRNGQLFTAQKRVTALNDAISKGYEIAIFDDGLQDASIKYDMEIVCFNNLNWIGNGLTIPSGPLRENINNLRFYNHIFLNGNEEKLTDIKNQIKKIKPEININQGKYVPLNIDSFNKKHNYLIFSGIGNHKTFVNMLRNNDLNIIDDLEFPDHYQYSKKDFDEIVSRAKKYDAKILTTEKDYLRLDSFDKSKILYIKSTLKILNEAKFIQTLVDLNEKN